MPEHTYVSPELEDVDVDKASAGQLQDLGPVPKPGADDPFYNPDRPFPAERYILHVPTGETVTVNDVLLRQDSQTVLTNAVRLAMRQHEIKQSTEQTVSTVDAVMIHMTDPAGGLSAVGVLVCLRLQEAGLIRPGPDA